MKRLRFYKDPDYKWYVDIPEWQGSKGELQMVCGADVMLDLMSEGQDFVWLTLSEVEFEGSDILSYVRHATEIENGAFYIMEKYRGINIGLEMWLCDVTKFVFGDFPKIIYLQSSSSL